MICMKVCMMDYDEMTITTKRLARANAIKGSRWCEALLLGGLALLSSRLHLARTALRDNGERRRWDETCLEWSSRIIIYIQVHNHNGALYTREKNIGP